MLKNIMVRIIIVQIRVTYTDLSVQDKVHEKQAYLTWPLLKYCSLHESKRSEKRWKKNIQIHGQTSIHKADFQDIYILHSPQIPEPTNW